MNASRFLLGILTSIILTFTSFSQTVTVVNPNGGEILYACQNYTITWNTSGTLSDYWDIEYSLDGGTIWATIATNYLNTSGQYVWTVPQVQSNTCLIRITDAQNGSYTDQSDAVFTINIPVTVLSPNGGETFQGGDIETITWNAQGTSNTYNIYYSVNGGSSWTTIVTGYNTVSGTYDWTVPNIPSTNCLIRVRDAVTSCMQDESDAVFTIIADDPVLISPNGAETWYAGCSYNITWDQATFYSNVRLEYSTDNGSTWTLIVSNTTNDGVYSWTVPYNVSSTCLVRASNVSDLAINDISDATFTIPESIVVTSPNGGEDFYGCSTYSISWTKPSSCISRFNVYYSLDNGTTWTLISSPYNSGSGYTQSTNWNVPNGVTTSQALIKVADYYDAAIFDISDVNFNIYPSNDITVTDPNGGETIDALTTYLITWTNLPSVSGLFTVQYSTNGGSSWTTIASSITGNAYNWSVPNIPSTNYLIKVYDSGNTCKFDESDATFTVVAATPILLTPNGGETFDGGCTTNITWDQTSFYSNIRLDYSDDGGTTWNNIVANTANDGLYTWTTPNLYSSNYLIVAHNTSDLFIADTSDAVFSVVEPITVTAPNGGESYDGCSTVTIDWNKPGSCISRFNIYYSTDNGATWTLISSPYNSGSGTTQSTNWSLPNTINSTQMLIKVADYYDAAVYDVSDASFTVAPSNDITVTSPNGGETYNAYGSTTITWTNTPQTSGTYNVQYSTNGGSSWTTIATGVTGNAYIWSIPNAPSTNCKVKVIDAGNTCKYDITDGLFTIEPPIPVLLTPNGGETLPAGCATDITWDAASFYSNVRLEYSTDGGTTWTIIVSSTSNDGLYSWTTPYTYSGNYLIKASNTSNLSLNDVSDAVFSVIEPIEVTSPNGGENFYGCSSYSLSWTKPSSCISRFNVYYSIDNGTTWTLITSPYNSGSGNTQSTNWTVPNGITTTQALIKVADYYNSSVYDISDANFNIDPSNDVTVTYPNGGETFNAYQNVTITWSNLPSASGLYTLQYSTNGGSSWTTIVSSITGNAYVWSVPNAPSTNCLIKVIDAGNTCKFDVSDATFTIDPPIPMLLTPNGGETLPAGCSTNITWDQTTFYSNVRLEYSTDGGTTWTTIVSSTTNDGLYSWTTPYTYSGNYLIKASNTSNLSLNDVSDAVFSVVEPIGVTSPNGGENFYGCSSYSISWTKPSSCISRFNVYYSLDDGATWTLITSPYNSGSGNTQSTNWSVPNGITTTQALIKVADYYNASVYDVSDANFNIDPSNDVTVTYPNGGESFNAYSTVTVTWTNLPSASGIYNVQYSTNGGSSWVNIATGVTGNATNWTVPNVPSTNCLIKVIDAGNTCKFDISDATFTIIADTPVLLTPNGGEQFYPGCSASITWDPVTLYSNARLEYSTDGGTTWTVIVASTTNDGQYTWTPPYTYSANYLVKICNTSDLFNLDISDATFEVIEPIEVTAMNGGEVLDGCSSYSIQWNKPGSCISRFNIYYSIDNGATWTLLSSPYNSGSGNTQSTNWNVPNTITTTQALIKVADYYNASVYDVSDANFTINPSNDVTVTSPNGGETMQGLSTYTITWTNTPAASGQYSLQYSTNGGSSWTTIVTNITGNAYVWSVPNIPSTNCLIKVIDYVNTCKYDISDAVFEITPATPIVLTPNGGESMYAATTYSITWDQTTYFSNVRIEYSTDNGFTWNVIVSSTTNDGQYNWNVPNTPSTQCLVKISNTSNLSVNDVSDNVFEIKAAVTILTPNGDNGITDWGGCTVTSITFDHTPYYDRWNIYYSLDGGSTWNTIAYNWYQTANPATYNWTIPNTSSSQVLVKVEPYYQNSYYDVSDATFTVDKPVTIIQPNFGGIMQVGSIYNIEWDSDGISNIYDIFFSDNGGTTWSTVVIGYNTSTNTYPWTVPNNPSTNCLIRVRDNINQCKEDTSDVAFTITNSTPALTVMDPNGSDTLYGCNDHLITWSEPSPAGTYDIAYSTNSGSSWTDIVTNYTTGVQEYNWTVPNMTSSTVLIRVKVYGTAIEDLSDALFTILPGSLDVTTNDMTVCVGTDVALNVNSSSSVVWSPAASLDDPNSLTPVATPWETTTYIAQSTNGTCVLEDSVTITTNTIGAVVVTVDAGAAPSNVICSGESVTFTATPTNGGTTPAYQWQLNGANVGTDSDTYINASLNDGDEVTVIMTSDQSCVLNQVDTSTAIIMDVSSSSVPDVAIAPSTGTSICSGDNVVFTATPTNGGATPSYQWQVNGSNVGTDSDTYTTTGLNDGDQVTVIMTSSSSCAIGGPVTSSPTTMTVNTVPAQPLSISGGSALCEGDAENYSIAAVSGALSYSWTIPGDWSGTGTTTSLDIIAGTTSGNVMVTADNGCGSSPAQSISVTVNTLPIVNANTSAGTVCNGNTVTLSGTGAVSYAWDNGVSDGIPFAPSGTATYTVTGTDANGCSDSEQITVFVNALPNVAANTTATTLCEGDNVTLNGSGAVSYSWDNGVTDNVAFSPSSSATYTVTGTDANGCINTDQVTVSVNPIPNVVAGGDLTVCENDLVVLSGSGASTYNWDNGITDGVAFTATTTTTYIVTGTDGNGCTDKDTVVVNVNSLPTVTANTTSTAICNGSSVTLNGTGASTYAWDNGVTDGAAFNPSATLTYTVIGTDANGCTNTDQVMVTVNALPTVIANTTSTDICPGEDITLTGSGANTYAWDNGVLDGVATSPAVTTTYTVTGTDVNGCTNTDQVTVNVHAAPNVSAGADLMVCENSSVTLSGSGATSYTWDNGITNGVPFSATATTTYIVTGTDGNGCMDKDTVIVNVQSAPTIVANTSSNVICIGSPITLTGSGAVSYSWNNGVTDGVAFNPSSTLTYTVTGTDVNGCTNTDQVTVTVNTLPTVVANASAASICPGEDVTLSGLGANTYSWDNGVLDGVPTSPASTTTYTVTGTDANGCVNTDQVMVSVHNAPSVSAGSDLTVCQNSSVTLSGTGANTYSWDNGISDGIAFTALTTTTYIVTGTDGNGCTDNDTVVVNVQSAPIVTANATATSICVGSPVTLTGSGAASYSWDNGVTDGVAFNPSSTITYLVTGTDGNGCINTDQITVNVNTLPAVVANATSTSLCQGDDVTFTGSGAGSYSWDNGVLDGVAMTPASTNTYTVTGTDVNGCVNTDQVMVTVNSLPSITASGTATICEGESTAVSATGASTYTWDNGGGSGSTVNVSPAVSTLFTVTGTDVNGCTATDQVTITVNPAPSVVAAGATALCDGESATLTVSGADSYAWDNGAGTGASVNVSPTATTTYTVTGTDAIGCTNTDQVTVTVNPLPTIVASGISPICEGEIVTLSVSGGDTYTWDNGAGSGASVDVSPATATTYTVTGTDANGCVNTDQVTIDVNAAPTPVISASNGELSTGTYASYQWYVNSTPISGATSQTHIYTENGDYYVEVTDGNGCSGTSPLFNVSDAGLEDAKISDVIFYPNPSTGIVNIEFGSLKGEKVIQLIDMSGKIVYANETLDETFMIELDIAAGYYQLQILSSKELILNEKLVIQP